MKNPFETQQMRAGKEFNAIDEEKYKYLYDYHKDQYLNECSRFNRLEDKAVRYLSSLTIAVSTYVLLVRWSADKIIPPDGFIGWLAVISMIITFFSMASAWSFIFRSIKLQNIMKMPTGSKITEYFQDNDKATIYLGLANRYAEAAKSKSEEYGNKLKNVKKGYEEIVFAGYCFIMSVVLIFTRIWIEG